MARKRQPEKKCKTPSCQSIAELQGRCRKCYHRIERNGRAVAVMPKRNPWLKHPPREGRTCLVKGCARDYFSSGYCRRHYMQVWRWGRITDGEPKERRPEITEHVVDPDAVRLSLRRARDAYSNAVGLTARMYWRRQVVERETELTEALKAAPALV